MAAAPTGFRMAGLTGGLAGQLHGRARQTRLESQVEGNPRGGHQLDAARVWHVKVHRKV